MNKLEEDIHQWKKEKQKVSKYSVGQIIKATIVYLLVPLQLYVGLMGVVIAGMAINGMAVNGGIRQQPEYGDVVISVYLVAYFFSIFWVIYALVFRQQPRLLSWWQIGFLAVLPTAVWAAGLVLLSVLGLDIR